MACCYCVRIGIMPTHAAGARVFVVVDTNILLSHLNFLERTMNDFAGAATQARWAAAAAACLCNSCGVAERSCYTAPP